MRNWKYNEPLGTDLRILISEENHKEILKLIFEICKKYAELTKDEDDMSNDFEELMYLVEGEWDYKDEELSEYGWDSWTELVDERLYEVYNACDGKDVFLNL